MKHKHKIQKKKRKITNLLKETVTGEKARTLLLHLQDSVASKTYSVTTQVDIPVL